MAKDVAKKDLPKNVTTATSKVADQGISPEARIRTAKEKILGEFLDEDEAMLLRQHLREKQLRIDELEARISAYELAFRMQTAAPELVDLAGETDETKALYGLNDPKTAGFGRQCLLARRLVERGVRHTLLLHGVQIGKDSWDDHGNVKDGMIKHSREVDLPVAGLLERLATEGGAFSED